MFDTAIETAYTVTTPAPSAFDWASSHDSDDVSPLPTVLLSHDRLNRWDMAARYVVAARHKRGAELLICDVAIPARIERSLHRRVVERVIGRVFPEFHLPSQGENPWYLHDLSEACPF